MAFAVGLIKTGYMFGAGVRLQQGQAFVVCADVAWSPDSRPVGAYLVADEIF
jgi:hypothetical protein